MSTATPWKQMTQTAFRMFFLLRNPKVLHFFQQGMKALDVWISLMSGRSVRRATRARPKWRSVVMLKSPTCCLAAVPNTALNLPQEPPSTTSWRSEKGIETNGVHKTRSFGSLVAFCVLFIIQQESLALFVCIRKNAKTQQKHTHQTTVFDWLFFVNNLMPTTKTI